MFITLNYLSSCSKKNEQDDMVQTNSKVVDITYSFCVNWGNGVDSLQFLINISSSDSLRFQTSTSNTETSAHYKIMHSYFVGNSEVENDSLCMIDYSIIIYIGKKSDSLIIKEPMMLLDNIEKPIMINNLCPVKFITKDKFYGKLHPIQNYDENSRRTATFRITYSTNNIISIRKIGSTDGQQNLAGINGGINVSYNSLITYY